MLEYFSIDIETCGLNSGNSLLEVGIIFDDMALPLNEDTPRLRLVIIEEDYVVAPFCATLHEDLWREINSLNSELGTDEVLCALPFTKLPGEVNGYPKNIVTTYCGLKDVGPLIGTFVSKCGHKDSINVAGKNYFAFDHNWLKPLLFNNVRQRALDPGILYTTCYDDKVADTEQCINVSGIRDSLNHMEQYRHTAVFDAWIVCRLLRLAMQQSDDSGFWDDSGKFTLE